MASKFYVDVVLLALGAAIMSWLASSLINPELLLWDNMNIWFGSDIPRVMKNMTVRIEGHNGSFKHPLFALLVWPPTALIHAIVGDAFTAVRIVMAANAACAVCLLMSLSSRIGLTRIDRILVTLLFIASSGFMFWYSVPETFAFGSTSILLALFAAPYAVKKETDLWPFVIFGLAGLSMTITNFGVFCIALLCGLWAAQQHPSLKDVLLRAIKPLFFVLFTGAVLAVVQDQVFGDAGLFFNVKALAGETKFIGQPNSAPLVWRPVILILGSIVTGGLSAVPSVNRLPAGDVDIIALAMPTYTLHDGTASGVQIIAACLFLIFFIGGIIAFLRLHIGGYLTAAATATLEAASLSAIFFILLHMLYGSEVFLYSAHMLPLVVVILAGGLMSVRGYLIRVLFAALIATAGVHNFWMLIDAHDQIMALNF